MEERFPLTLRSTYREILSRYVCIVRVHVSRAVFRDWLVALLGTLALSLRPLSTHLADGFGITKWPRISCIPRDSRDLPINRCAPEWVRRVPRRSLVSLSLSPLSASLPPCPFFCPPLFSLVLRLSAIRGNVFVCRQSCNLSALARKKRAAGGGGEERNM